MIKEDQERVQEMYLKLRDCLVEPPPFDAWAFTVTELGEVGSCLLSLGFGMSQGYVRGHPDKWKKAFRLLALEMGQTLLMLLVTANRLGLDMDLCLNKAIEEMYRRCEGAVEKSSQEGSEAQTEETEEV